MPTSTLPKHIAFIMDGNGRWAKAHKKTRHAGHKAGSLALERCIEYCLEYKIKYLSAYTFSTENWNRPKKEVSFLMNLLVSTLTSKLTKLHEKKINLNFIGNTTKLNQKIKDLIQLCKDKKIDQPTLTVNLMFNYGSRDEIVTACNHFVQTRKETPHTPITEEVFGQQLWTASMPDPDIIVRPSNEFRLSNFMLWQSSYAELIFLKEYWPDFNEQLFKHVLDTYKQRKRRYGTL